MSHFPFQAGGPLLADSPVYVPREADEKAAAHLRRMEYITLVEPRQHGKISLINQLIGQFSSRGYVFATRDLMAAKSSATSPTDWYASLGKWLLRQLRFIPRDQRPEPPTDSASWEEFLADVAESAMAAGQKVVIVFDEIGAMPSKWATDFFSVIRSVYTSRQSLPFWQHLTFIIAGAFNPKELIQDDTVSNFNIDQRIPLNDFNLSQMKQLVAHLSLPDELSEAVAEQIHYWTGGQPYLSQWLCLHLAEQRGPVTVAAVDDAVERFLHDDTHHLARIKDLIAEPDLLTYIRRITNEPRSRLSPALNEKHFRLAHIIGVIKADLDRLCKIRNRIYERALAEIEMLSESKPPETPQPSDEFRYDAFISYSHKDSAWVRDTLLPRLEGEGLRVCIDFRDFEPGAPSLTEMERAVLQSRKTLLVLTPQYLASEWAEFENILASTLDPAARRRRVIPLLLKPCELPLRIRALTYLDFTKPDETEFQFQRLVAALQGTASATVLEESISSSLEEEKPLWAVSAPNVHKSLSYPKEHPVVDNSKGMRSRYVHTVKNVSAEVAAAAFDAFGRDLASDIGIRFKRKHDIRALVEYAILTVDIDQRSNLILGESDRGTVRFQTLPSDTLEVSIEVLPAFPRGWRIPSVTDEMVLNFFNSFVDHLRGLEPSPLPDSTLQAKKRRLHVLKLEQARKGYNTPPEVLMEIEDLEREIDEYRE